jgi:hypothetical protein
LRAAAALRYTQGEEARMTVPDLLPPDHRPDYRRLEKVLTRSAIPDRVPFYEPFIEGTMVERMTDANNAACMEGGGYALGTGNSPATCVHLDNFYAVYGVGFAHGRYGAA